jgi:hypothetical protein
MMDIESALSDSLVHFIECENDIFRLKFGVLEPVVTIKVFKVGFRDYDCDQSHIIHAAGFGPYFRSSFTRFPTKAETLYRAVSKFTFFYRKSVAKGHRPQDSWLRPVEGWRDFI